MRIALSVFQSLPQQTTNVKQRKQEWENPAPLSSILLYFPSPSSTQPDLCLLIFDSFTCMLCSTLIHQNNSYLSLSKSSIPLNISSLGLCHSSFYHHSPFPYLFKTVYLGVGTLNVLLFQSFSFQFLSSNMYKYICDLQNNLSSFSLYYSGTMML